MNDIMTTQEVEYYAGYNPAEDPREEYDEYEDYADMYEPDCEADE